VVASTPFPSKPISFLLFIWIEVNALPFFGLVHPSQLYQCVRLIAGFTPTLRQEPNIYTHPINPTKK
jgi:hypothetical protein